MEAHTINRLCFSVASFASDFEYAEIERFLFKQSYFSSRISDVDIKLGKIFPDTALAVIIGENASDAEILHLLDKNSDTSCLGIFCTNDMLTVQKISNRFSETILWPCDQREFLIKTQSIEQKMIQNRFNSNMTETSSDRNLNIIGSSSKFSEVMRRVKVFAACDAPVLIEGETGTGKEMVARAIHYFSMRHSEAFIPVNCGALPDSLMENELFGHEKGAYTDAKIRYHGVIAQAHDGTLFLDEIESLTPKAQVTLLRFLQEQEYRPLGSLKSFKANVRIVAASNESVEKLVKGGILRQDLLYRLNILSIKLPPLRSRPEDLIPLTEFFLKRLRTQYRKEAKYLSDQVINWIKSYSWPGNVRELENLLHRAFLVSQKNEIQLADLIENEPLLPNEQDDDLLDFDENILCEISFNAAKSKIIDKFEKKYLCQLMEKSNGNITLAAKAASKERRALGKLLKKHGIDKSWFIL